MFDDDQPKTSAECTLLFDINDPTNCIFDAGCMWGPSDIDKCSSQNFDAALEELGDALGNAVAAASIALIIIPIVAVIVCLIGCYCLYKCCKGAAKVAKEMAKDKSS